MGDGFFALTCLSPSDVNASNRLARQRACHRLAEWGGIEAFSSWWHQMRRTKASKGCLTCAICNGIGEWWIHRKILDCQRYGTRALDNYISR